MKSIIGLVRLLAGNHNDSYELKETIWKLFKDLQRLGLCYKGAIFNADKSFDSSEARKMVWHRGVRPNIPDNKRSRKHAKRGRKRYFNRGCTSTGSSLNETSRRLTNFGRC